MSIRNILAREEALYVEHPAEEEIYKQLGEHKLFVVKGPKGDGLSVVTMAALVRKMLFDRVVVVDVLMARDCLGDVARLLEVVDAIRELNREPIFYLDLSRPGQYAQKPWQNDARYMPNGLDEFAKMLEELEAAFVSKDVTVVAILSDDLYGVLKNELKEHTTVEVNSNNVHFLKELAQAYSSCSEDIAKEIAEAVTKHDCGRAVLATLAADWLSQRNCDRTAVPKALKAAEEKAKELYINYIWRVVLNSDRPYANLHAPLLILRRFEGPMTAEDGEEFLISLGFKDYKVRGSHAVRWIAAQHCDLIEGAIEKAVDRALKERVKYDLYGALRYALEDYYKYFKAKGYLQ
jgi:hypothetical protein